MTVSIGERLVGDSHPVFIIAELSCNHLQRFDLALKTIDAIKEAGADAVKMSTDLNDGGITIDCDKEWFRLDAGTLWDGRTLFELYEEAFTPWEWQPKLKEYAESLGLVCFSTATDYTAVDFLERMDVPAYKIASFELNDIPLIEYAARKGKPMILSTGIARLPEICEAVEACRRVGNEQIVLLKATSAYPAPLGDVNLATIPHLKATFDVVVGLSDHTLTEAIPVASVALGGRVVEKHFILDRTLGGPDAEFSMDAREFASLCRSIRQTERALGTITYELPESVRKNAVFRKSLFIVEDVEEGEPLTEKNVKSIRPGYGLPPKLLPEILGRRAKQRMERGTPLTWGLL